MPAALEVRQLSKTLKTGERLVEDVSFRVETGEFVALIGASGAGKSLTLRCILGLTTPTAGHVLFTDRTGKDHALNEASRKGLREARGKMGVIFQGANLVSRLTALENVMIGFHRRETASILANLLSLPSARAETVDLALVQDLHLACFIIGWTQHGLDVYLDLCHGR